MKATSTARKWHYRRKKRANQNPGGGDAYTSRVLTLTPIAYYPLSEAAGTTAEDVSGNNYDGTYSGAVPGGTGVGDGNTAGSFDGTTDYIDISAMAGAFDGDSGSILVWGKTAAWADATARYLIRIAASGNHHVYIQKTAVDNTLLFLRKAGIANTKSVSDTSLAGTADYFHLALTWDTDPNELKAYINGAQVGTTQTGLASFVGTPGATATVIGATDTGGASSWSGTLAHVAIFDYVLSGAEIADIAQLEVGSGPTGDGLLAENSNFLTAESGDYLILES
jgi:hypothetical protein